MKQILVIGGGMTFDTYDEYLSYLGDRQPQLDDRIRRNDSYLTEHMRGIAHVSSIEMPSRRNAQYIEWEIIFSKFLEIVDISNTILIGISLGGAFLVRYLSENNLHEIDSVHLLCTPVSNKLPGETLTNGFCIDHQKISTLNTYGPTINFHNSLDDDSVPLSEMQIFQSLLPQANYYTYNNKNGHFIVEEFPEIIELLKN